MKTANYYTTFETLEYRVTENTTSFVDCSNIETAKALIEMFWIEQSLEVN